MKLDRFIRVAIAVVVLLVFIVATGALLFISESALNVWDRLKAGPPALLYAYVSVMLLLTITALWLVWRLVIRRKISPAKTLGSASLSKADIESRLREAERAGVDVSEAQAELKELAARKDAVHLCFFGEVSSGKSSLIRALVPDADVVVDVVGGSTDDIRHHRWRDDSGAEILLTDVPGIGGNEDGLTAMATEEAKRANVVLFVCDSDLTRPEIASITSLLTFDKPLVIVLNKADRFTADEQATLMEKLLERIDTIGGQLDRDHVVAVSAGGEIDVIERGTDGSEESTRRTRPADIGVLVVAINRMLAEEGASLDARRERAVFRMAAARLEEAEGEYRLQRSEQIIRSSTRKAIVGALAAISPGTDILIQGYIGTAMTQELCKLYGATPRDLDIEEFLNLSQSRVGRALPLSLAVAGNGLKAFPGLGTVAGGAVHAVAYGLIFDALGRSLVLTLSRHGTLLPEVAAKEFEEGISGHLEAGVRRVAKMALDEKQAEDGRADSADHLGLARESLRELVHDTRLPAGVRDSLIHDYEAVQGMLDKIEHGHLHLSVFGRVSTGKSSLLNALIGEERFSVSPIHGETRYSSMEAWSEVDAGGVFLIDTPGLDEAGGEDREALAREVAGRSDLVIFVLDGDITETELEALRAVLAQGRPVIVALNKADLYTSAESDALLQSIRAKTEGLIDPAHVIVAAGQPRAQVVVEVDTAGEEATSERVRDPDVGELRLKLWEILESEGKTLAALNASLFAADLSDQVGRRIIAARKELGDRMVRTYCVGKGIAVALNPVPVADLFAAAFIDVGMVVHLSRVYDLPLSRKEAGSIVRVIVAESAALMTTVWALHLVSSALKVGTLGLSTILTAGAQGAIAYYSTYLVGEAAGKYLAEGKSWGDGGPKKVVKEILDSLDRDTVLNDAKREIQARLGLR